MGVDPGYGRMGYGIIDCQGNKLKHIDNGVVETPSGDDFPDRLHFLYKNLTKIIKKYKPEVMAVEDLFFYKNSKTAIKVGQARGVIVLTGVVNHLQIMEFTPLQVKQAVACYGRAEKSQVQRMIKVILNLITVPKLDDAADALALAICASSNYKLHIC